MKDINIEESISIDCISLFCGQHPTGINHDIIHQYFRSDVTSKGPVNRVSSVTSHSVMYMFMPRHMKHCENLMGDVMIYTRRVLLSD
jgi:hypothetical protein